MSSELKLTNLKHASSSSNNLVLASDGNVSITNTLSAGALGDNVTGKLTQMTSQSLSGEGSNTFTVPTTTKKITVVFQGVSEGGGSNILLRIGTGGFLSTSGYSGTAASLGNGAHPGVASTTSGVELPTPNAANVISGICDWCNITGNTWVGKYQATLTNSAYQYQGITQITLSGAINIVGIMDSADAFDAGDVNVFYSH